MNSLIENLPLALVVIGAITFSIACLWTIRNLEKVTKKHSPKTKKA